MYKKVDNNLRMSENEAYIRYPDSFILMRRDSGDISNRMGTILYVGDDYDELFSLMIDLGDPLGIVLEGLNHQRSLGGIVVGG